MSSVRIAQAFDQPAARALKRPLGASVSQLPQQAMVPSLRIAQEKPVPEATALKLPLGALVRPNLLSPQQAMVSSVRIAQLVENDVVRDL